MCSWLTSARLLRRRVAMAGENACQVLRPRSLASSIAASACLSSCCASVPSAGQVATPTDTVIMNSSPSCSNGRWKASLIASATCAGSIVALPGRTTRNSSPAKRPQRAVAGSEPCSRSAALASRWSPTSAPSMLLITLKRSRSTYSSEGPMPPRAAAIWRSSSCRMYSRLASPVSGSVTALRRSFCSSSLRSVMSWQVPLMQAMSLPRHTRLATALIQRRRPSIVTISYSCLPTCLPLPALARSRSMRWRLSGANSASTRSSVMGKSCERSNRRYISRVHTSCPVSTISSKPPMLPSICVCSSRSWVRLRSETSSSVVTTW